MIMDCEVGPEKRVELNGIFALNFHLFIRGSRAALLHFPEEADLIGLHTILSANCNTGCP